MNAKTWLVLGASLGVLAVLAGTIGEHYLSPYLNYIGTGVPSVPDAKRWWETAARYQMYHSLALLAVGMVADRRPSKSVHLAGLAMFLGTLIFSGCLYAMALSNLRVLGAVVPLGGLLMMAGWVFLALAVRGFEPGQPGGAPVRAPRAQPALAASAETAAEDDD